MFSSIRLSPRAAGLAPLVPREAPTGNHPIPVRARALMIALFTALVSGEMAVHPVPRESPGEGGMPKAVPSGNIMLNSPRIGEPPRLAP